MHVARLAQHDPRPPRLAREGQRTIDDDPCCVRTREPARRRCHPRAPAGVTGQRQNPLRQPLGSGISLQEHVGGAVGGERLRVLALVIVGGRRQRDQESLPFQPPLGQRRGAPARQTTRSADRSR